jgi:signal peptide peptidase SppA
MKLLGIISTPWAIVPEKLAEIQNAYKIHFHGKGADVWNIEKHILDQRNAEDADNETAYENIDGVAVIPIAGIITKNLSVLSLLFDATLTMDVSAMLNEALGDASVKAILFYIDSPGGTVDGTQELSEQIYAARGKKLMISFTDGMMASAAYYIGAAADAIYISGDMVHVGSIGVAMRHLDYSRADEMHGYKETDIYSGYYKRIATGNRPLSEEGHGYLQSRVDYIYSRFVDDVAKYRGVSSQEVMATMADGKIFIGTQALNAGLIDGIVAYNRLIERMAAGDADILKPNNIRRGRFAKQARQRASLWDWQLAKLAGISCGQLWRFEDGTETPSHELAVRLNKVLKVQAYPE